MEANDRRRSRRDRKARALESRLSCSSYNELSRYILATTTTTTRLYNTPFKTNNKFSISAPPQQPSVGF
jgi:hypothetical protein